MNYKTDSPVKLLQGHLMGGITKPPLYDKNYCTLKQFFRLYYVLFWCLTDELNLCNGLTKKRFLKSYWSDQDVKNAFSKKFLLYLKIFHHNTILKCFSMIIFKSSKRQNFYSFPQFLDMHISHVY